MGSWGSNGLAICKAKTMYCLLVLERDLLNEFIGDICPEDTIVIICKGNEIV